jgi:hypothetical protein
MDQLEEKRSDFHDTKISQVVDAILGNAKKMEVL